MTLKNYISNKNILVFLSVIIFFSSIVFTNFGFLKDRDYPYGFDNHFSFLIKSKNFEHCFFNKCSGLASIESQVESFNEGSENQLERLKAQIFKIYHPLYSILILATDFFFDDLLKSRLVLHFLFIFLILYSLILLSNLLFNKYTTCLILIFFSLNNYGGWGFGHQINPFILSQSFSMLIYYYLIKDYKIKATFVNIFASLMHPIGIFTNLLTIIFVLFTDFKKHFGKNFLLILVNFFLILFIYFNELSFFENVSIKNNQIFSYNVSYFEILKKNIITFFYTYKILFNLYTLPVILFSPIIYSLLKKDKKITLLIILTYLMIFITVILDKPGVRLPQRFLNISGLILAGSFLYVLIYYLKIFVTYLKEKKYKHHNFIKNFEIIIFPILILCFFSNIKLGIENFKNYYSYFDINYDISFSKNQIKLIEDNSIIIFNDFERADYFFMLHGLHKNNLFYYANKDKVSFNKDFLKSDKTKYFVSMSPFYHDEIDEYFSKGDKITISNNEYDETFLKLGSSQKSKILINNKIVDLNNKGLKNSSTDLNIRGTKIIIEVLHGKIKFLKLGKPNYLNFPWESKISIFVKSKNFEKKIDFKKYKVLNCDTEIINDQGSSILQKLTNCKI